MLLLKHCNCSINKLLLGEWLEWRYLKITWTLGENTSWDADHRNIIQFHLSVKETQHRKENNLEILYLKFFQNFTTWILSYWDKIGQNYPLILYSVSGRLYQVVGSSKSGTEYFISLSTLWSEMITCLWLHSSCIALSPCLHKDLS